MFLDWDKDEDEEDGETHGRAYSLKVEHWLGYLPSSFFFELLSGCHCATFVVDVSEDWVCEEEPDLFHLVLLSESSVDTINLEQVVIAILIK